MNKKGESAIGSPFVLYSNTKSISKLIYHHTFNSAARFDNVNA